MPWPCPPFAFSCLYVKMDLIVSVAYVPLLGVLLDHLAGMRYRRRVAGEVWVPWWEQMQIGRQRVSSGGWKACNTHSLRGNPISPSAYEKGIVE